jgi:hypothetical protein
MHDVTGSFVPGFTIWAALSWVLAVGGLLLPETGPRGKKPAAELSATVAAAEPVGAAR